MSYIRYDGRAYRLRLEGDSVASEALAHADAEALLERPLGAPDHLGRRLLVADRYVLLCEPEPRRRARLLGEYDRLLAATDDGVTVLIERNAYVLIGDIDESKLEWHDVPASARARASD